MLNELFDQVDDYYLDVYYKTKENLMRGQMQIVQTEMSNIKGLTIVQGPKRRANITAGTELLNALGLTFHESYVRAENRFPLARSKKEELYLLFPTDEIEFELKTKSNSLKFSGTVVTQMEPNKIINFIESVTFDKQDSISLFIKLIKDGSRRGEFERAQDTEIHSDRVKMSVINQLKIALERYQSKDKWARKLNELTIIKSFGISDKSTDAEIYPEAKRFIDVHKDSPRAMKNFKSIQELEKKSGVYNDKINYKDVLKMLTSRK